MRDRLAVTMAWHGMVCRAARCAVLGALSHIHGSLKKHEGKAQHSIALRSNPPHLNPAWLAMFARAGRQAAQHTYVWWGPTTVHAAVRGRACAHACRMQAPPPPSSLSMPTAPCGT